MASLRSGVLRLAAAAAVLMLVARPRPAAAQDAFGASSPAPTQPATQGTEQAVVGRYWELGRPRVFLATTAELGYAYARPRFSFGYGLPYWRWIGVESYPLVAFGSLGAYAGVGGAIPGLTFRAGARYTYPFNRTYLAPQESFTRTDTDIQVGERARYLAYEAEATATAPLWIGSLFAIGTFIRTAMTEEGFYLYEESLRQVMKPPYIWRGRVGYLAAFGRRGAIRLGVAGDVIGLPGRDDLVVRAGVLGSVVITAALEAQASFIPVIVSPDSLGIVGGDFGQLGVRFRWGTDSTPDPEKVRKAREEDAKKARQQEAEQAAEEQPAR